MWGSKNIYFYLSKTLRKLFLIGINGSLYQSENRTTLYTNLMTTWGMFSVVPLIFFLESNGIHSDVYGIVYSVLFCSGLVVFRLNYSQKYLVARLLGLLVINLAGWQASLLFGKTFNGYLMFFVALLYSILAMAKAPFIYRLASFVITFLGLPLVDYLSFNKIIPITGFDSKNYTASLLIVDTVVTTGFISIIMYIEKLYSNKYEDELSEINENLEELVRVRSESLMKEKEQNLQVTLMRSQFLANISHELRIPLQGILGYVELGEKNLKKVQATPLSDEQKVFTTKLDRSFTKINLSMTRLLDLIGRLFKITESGQYKAHPNDFNIKNAIESVVSQFKVNADKVNLKIDSNIDKIIFSDIVLLQQSLICLLDNAKKFSDEGSEIKLHSYLKNNDLYIEVFNQGVGIIEKEKEVIFEAFFQGSLTDKGTGGTGIGLTLCRKYMSTIGGDVFLKDSSPLNTCFVLKFPENYFEKINFAKAS